jgi:hypothetical protein
MLVAYSSFLVPRFPGRAVLRIDGGEARPLKRSSRRTFFRAQRIVLGGSPPFDLGLDESVAELRAVRKGDGVVVDPLGREDVTYDNEPLDQPRPVYYRGTISAMGSRVQYDRMERAYRRWWRRFRSVAGSPHPRYSDPDGQARRAGP